MIYNAIPRKAKRREIKLLLSSCFPRLGPIISTEVFSLLNGPKDLLTSATTDSDWSADKNGSLMDINCELSSNCICDLVKLGDVFELKFLSWFFKAIILLEISLVFKVIHSSIQLLSKVIWVPPV